MLTMAKATKKRSSVELPTDDKVKLRQLQAERTSGNRWLVSSGLQAGDRLITEGLQYVRPGDQVKVAPASNVAAEPAEQSGLAKSH